MTKEEKEIQETKRDIAKRLRLSDLETWKSLSNDQQEKIVDKYYHLFDIDKVGIHKVIEDSWNVRFGLNMALFGVLFGILGGISGNIFTKYISSSIYSDIFFMSLFILAFVLLVKEIDKIGVKRLRENKVLKYLIKSKEKIN